MMPRRVRVAILIAFICHGLFIVSGRYRLSYDAYTHMLFANHYAENWFSLWETRWYTGFAVISYPPLTHQLIALFVPFLGFEIAFALILWIVTTFYPVGIYAFARIFTGKTSASYAALASAILLPVYVTAHIFGQLPFLTSTLIALFAAASLDRYLQEGGLHNFALSVALITTSMAMHHATLMVQPFFIFAVVLNNLLSKKHSSRFVVSILQRLFIFGGVSIITSLIVIFPFWGWGASQTMQVPIDHLSRHNFFTDALAPAIFLLPLYGPFVVLIPFLVRKWHPRFVGLLFSFFILFLLGLGGTTPLPRIFFGAAWEWLTYDRFAFWACLTLTPFFGMLFIQLKRGRKNRLVPKPVPVTLRRGFISAATFSVFTITALGAWFTPIFFPIQPSPINMQPIVAFLNDGTNSNWRYLTFGFGDQFAYLNLLTKATTIDGSYHTARTLPELRESGIGQVDTSYWARDGIALIKPILMRSGEHSVRWGFVNPKTLEAVELRWGTLHRSPFVPLLEQLGWQQIKTLANGILVFENTNAMPLERTREPTFSPLMSFAWGVLPLLVFVGTSALAGLRIYPVQAEWVIQKIYSFAIGLLPITLCFWMYRTIGDFPHDRVYFTYTNALFFLSDALVLLAVLLWLAVKVSHGLKSRAKTVGVLAPFIILPLAFLLVITLSTLWSRDWRTSLYISVHCWLLYLFILSLRDWHESWKIAAVGFCGALSIQLVAGFAEFGLQSTSFLQQLNMEWPGILDPSVGGASVVQLSNGLRILRSYGTLPHPNILGGFTLISLLGPMGLYLLSRKANYPALLLLGMGLVLLGLSFSRSAWLGLIVFIGVLLVKAKYFDKKRLILLISATMIAMSLALYPLRELAFTRMSNQNVATEKISAGGRSWLAQQAVNMIQKHPLLGVGIGSFILEMSGTAAHGAPMEPVHNLPLLVTAELGVAGMLLGVGVLACIALIIIRARSAQAVLASALIMALGIISLFDHYLWTLPPGRIMIGLALGLWAGQVKYEA